MQPLVKIVYLDSKHPVAVKNGNCGFSLISVSQDGSKAIVESVMSFVQIDRSERFEVDVKDLKD